MKVHFVFSLAVRIFDIRPYAPPQRCVAVFVGHQHNFEKNLLKCAWSKDGKRISCGSGDRFVYIWETHTRKIQYKLPGHNGSVNDVVFHPNEPISRSIAAKGEVSTVNLISLQFYPLPVISRFTLEKSRREGDGILFSICRLKWSRELRNVWSSYDLLMGTFLLRRTSNCVITIMVSWLRQLIMNQTVDSAATFNYQCFHGSVLLLLGLAMTKAPWPPDYTVSLNNRAKRGFLCRFSRWYLESGTIDSDEFLATLVSQRATNFLVNENSEIRESPASWKRYELGLQAFVYMVFSVKPVLLLCFCRRNS